jgi:hypothetical protein
LSQIYQIQTYWIQFMPSKIPSPPSTVFPVKFIVLSVNSGRTNRDYPVREDMLINQFVKQVKIGFGEGKLFYGDTELTETDERKLSNIYRKEIDRIKFIPANTPASPSSIVTDDNDNKLTSLVVQNLQGVTKLFNVDISTMTINDFVKMAQVEFGASNGSIVYRGNSYKDQSDKLFTILEQGNNDRLKFISTPVGKNIQVVVQDLKGVNTNFDVNDNMRVNELVGVVTDKLGNGSLSYEGGQLLDTDTRRLSSLPQKITNGRIRFAKSALWGGEEEDW